MKQQITTIATCWLLTLKSGEKLGFTDHDEDITFNGLIFSARTGITPSSIPNTCGTNIDNFEIGSILNSDLISEQDISQGKFDYADLKIFILDYMHPEKNAIKFKRGSLGEIRRSESGFFAEVCGMTQMLEYSIGESYSPNCRAALGDTKCKIKLEHYTRSAQVDVVYSTQEIESLELMQVENYYYNFGFIKFTGGRNKGIQVEIARFYEGKITLAIPLNFLPLKGDIFTITAGCDKRFKTCRNKFNNQINFRGEPHIPKPEIII